MFFRGERNEKSLKTPLKNKMSFFVLLPSEVSEAKTCSRFRTSAGNTGHKTSRSGIRGLPRGLMPSIEIFMHLPRSLFLPKINLIT